MRGCKGDMLRILENSSLCIITSRSCSVEVPGLWAGAVEGGNGSDAFDSAMA